ncbi:MAG: hypothetical protein K0R28_4387, partial [Paenibacillus sp.]|nr:hypothetical protein [Paenibacillus sp.]
MPEFMDDGGSDAMIWLLLIAGILVAGMLLFAFSDIRLKIRFSHTEGD